MVSSGLVGLVSSGVVVSVSSGVVVSVSSVVVVPPVLALLGIVTSTGKAAPEPAATPAPSSCRTPERVGRTKPAYEADDPVVLPPTTTPS